MQKLKHHTEYGTGCPVVFIHGSYASDSTWKGVIEAIGAEFHSIAIKLPGHCGLPDPDDFANPNINTEVQQIVASVAGATSEPVHLVGHSYGGVVALELAKRQAFPMKSLCLYEPVAGNILQTVDDMKNWQYLEQFVHAYIADAKAGKPDVAGRVIDFWGGYGAYAPLPDFIKQGMASLVQNNVRHWGICLAGSYSKEDITSIHLPTQIVYGSRSSAIAHAIAEHLVSLIPLAKSTLIEGANHFLVTTHAQQCADILLKLMQRAEPV